MLARRMRDNIFRLPGLARIAVLSLLLVALLAPAAPSLAQDAITAGTLVNADLEDGFELVAGGHGSVATAWEPWWIEGSAEEIRDGLLRAPTFAAEAQLTSPYGVHSRALGQSVSSLYGTHQAGIYQRVATAPGRAVRFSMWAYVWSSSTDDPDRSNKPGDYRVSVGIDPYGGDDATSDRVIWSPELVQYDEWIKLAVSATAQGDAVTVFTRGACSWRVKHNLSLWDHAALALAAAPSAPAPLSASPSLAAGPATTSAVSAKPVGLSMEDAGTTNALVNPDLEEEFSERGAGEVTVARGWHPWWEPGSEAQIAEGYLFRPEFKPERRGAGSGRVHAMGAAQKQFNTYATHRAGIYQRVPVSPGGRVTFAIWAFVWSSAEDDPEESSEPGDYRVSVGIDPTGGVDAMAESVVWSPARYAYDRWVELTVSAAAQGSHVTVFTRGEPGWRVKHNDSYWDDATLSVAGGAATAAGGASPTGLVPGTARVLSAPSNALPSVASANGMVGAIPGAAQSAAPPEVGTTTPPATRRPSGNVPDVARAPRPLGQEASLSFAGENLSLTWERQPEGVTIVVSAPNALEGELALYHEGHELARWAITLVPSDPLTLEWPGTGFDGGELGIEVRDSGDGVLARCGTLP